MIRSNEGIYNELSILYLLLIACRIAIAVKINKITLNAIVNGLIETKNPKIQLSYYKSY